MCTGDNIASLTNYITIQRIRNRIIKIVLYLDSIASSPGHYKRICLSCGMDTTEIIELLRYFIVLILPNK